MDQDEKERANANVVDAVNDALLRAVSGHPDTGAMSTSAVTIQVYADGNVSTHIAGLVDKVQIFGALVEAILTVHEVERNAALNMVMASSDAFYEKMATKERTDN